jgi:hypothetical protein
MTRSERSIPRPSAGAAAAAPSPFFCCRSCGQAVSVRQAQGAGVSARTQRMARICKAPPRHFAPSASAAITSHAAAPGSRPVRRQRAQGSKAGHGASAGTA